MDAIKTRASNAKYGQNRVKIGWSKIAYSDMESIKTEKNDQRYLHMNILFFTVFAMPVFIFTRS